MLEYLKIQNKAIFHFLFKLLIALIFIISKN